jgi:hypothetical protein
MLGNAFRGHPETRPLAVIAAILVIITLITGAMVLWTGPSTPSQPGGSPQSAIQNWAAAVEGEDWARADSYLSTRVQGTFTSAQLMLCGTLTGITVGTVSTTGTRASIQVVLEMSSWQGMPNSIPWSVDMVSSNGAWKIDGAPDTSC